VLLDGRRCNAASIGPHALPSHEHGIIQEIIMNTTQSRRRFLGVLSAGAAATVAPAALAATMARLPEPASSALAPAVAGTSEVDPIFEVIKRHKRAMKAYAKSYRRFQRHENDEQPPRGNFVVVGEQPERKLVTLTEDQWEVHHRWELTGKMVPLVARTRPDIEKNAPADLDETERARWIRGKYRELCRSTRAGKAAYADTPRSRAYDAWNEGSIAVERLTEELIETRPTTMAGIIAVVGYWAKVMETDDDQDSLYALDAISTKAFLRKLSKRAHTMRLDGRAA
jgi:hypothetical protein